MKKDLVDKLKIWLNKSRLDLLSMDICVHDDNNLNTIFEKIILENKENASNTFEYVRQQREIIKENIDRICVAPGEGGQWKNWQSELYLEEKLFPALFPYGIGGYLSSTMLNVQIM